MNSFEEALRAECRESCAVLQATIDRLMLEYCPEEMTTEQLTEWSAKSGLTEREVWQTKHEVNQRARYDAWQREDAARTFAWNDRDEN